MTTVWIGKARAVLRDRDLLGVGGEGSVYGWRDRAVKIYHRAGASGQDPAAAEARAKLALEKVRTFPRGLPPEVVAPLEVAVDDAGEAIGFVMRKVEAATEVGELANRKRRQGVWSNAEVCALFARLHAVLSALHARGVVAGDLNPSNVLFERTTPALIDADSMQFGRFPCVVAHERTLDPLLYGKDLALAPAFSPGTDWYAFAVLLFSALLYVHPYGGAHKTLPTMLRRAEAKHSVLRPDVAYPRAATAYAVLSDEMLARFAAVFDEGRREPFPAGALSARWTRCACGLEHARATCPACAAAVQVPASIAPPPGGGRPTVRTAVVARTRGRFVAAAVHGGRLRWAAVHEGTLEREDGSRVFVGSLPPDARVVACAGATWLTRGERIERATGGSFETISSASTFAGTAAFDANAASGFAVVDGWIVDLSRGTRVGQVLEGQTWLRVGDQMGLGLYRTGSITEHFAFRAGRGGMTRVALAGAGAVSARDRIVEHAAAFDGDLALLGLALDRDGRRVHALHVVRENGSVVASLVGGPDESPLLGSVSGLCLAYGAILCATEDGLLLARADAATASIVPEKTFPATQPFVARGAELLAAPGGSVYVVTPTEIVHLSLG